MPNHIEQPIVRTSRPALNDINEQYPGGQQSVSGLNIYAAQLGQRVILDGNPGGVRYDSTVGTLYGGWFQYVQTYASSVNSPAVGAPCAWAWDQASTAFEAYIVTPDTNSAIRVGRIAGIYLAALTKGNYGWIQTKGKCNVLFRSVLSTSGTPADGDLIVVDTTTGLADDLLQTNNPSYATLKAVIGTAIGAPVGNQKNLVLLRGIPEVI